MVGGGFWCTDVTFLHLARTWLLELRALQICGDWEKRGYA